LNTPIKPTRPAVPFPAATPAGAATSRLDGPTRPIVSAMGLEELTKAIVRTQALAAQRGADPTGLRRLLVALLESIERTLRTEPRSYYEMMVADRLELEKKLDEIRPMLAAVAAALHRVPGPMRGKLLAAMNEIVQSVHRGDMGGAASAAADLQGLTERCALAGDRIGAAMNQLSNMASSVPGSGKRLITAIMIKAQELIATASTPGDLEAIAGLLEQAVEIGRRMEGLKPGSPEFIACMEALGAVLLGLDALQQAHSPDSASAPDTEALRSAAQLLTELGAQAGDPFQRRQIAQLVDPLAAVEAQLAALPAPMRAPWQGRVNQLLSDAANGQLGEATGRAARLQAEVGAVAASSTGVEKKLALGMHLAASLPEPAETGLVAVLDKAEAAWKAASSPEALVAIAGYLDEATRQARALAKTPDGPAARKLSLIARQLDALLPPTSRRTAPPSAIAGESFDREMARIQVPDFPV
jgi:hypothetical protein